MHFGRVSDDRGLNLNLPEPRARTLGFLKLEHKGRGLIYPGAPVWAERDWLGSIYPEGLRPSEYLSHYARHYATVEYNGSFYHLPSHQQVRQWVQEVGPEFRFCPKIPQSISHHLHKDVNHADLQRYFALVENFGDHHGLSFMQLPDWFSPNHSQALADFLEAWSQNWPLAIEFRHPDWFSDQMLLDPLINLLYRHRVSAVITDTPGRRDVLHMSLTVPRLMIRFLGCFPSLKDDKRLRAWAKRIAEWTSKGMDEIYFFVHQARHGAIPQGVDFMVRALIEEDVKGLMRPAVADEASRDDSENIVWL